MGTHPIFESDFDCLTDDAIQCLCATERPGWPALSRALFGSVQRSNSCAKCPSSTWRHCYCLNPHVRWQGRLWAVAQGLWQGDQALLKQEINARSLRSNPSRFGRYEGLQGVARLARRKSPKETRRQGGQV